MNENELISIIVPVYKVEPYLERCLDSILNQTYTNFELILVDDGSPDNCPEICDNYLNKDFRVHVIHKENGGLSDARNTGINMAHGEWISFIDSDDVVNPLFLEYLYRGVKDTNSKISVCQFTCFDEIVPNITDNNNSIKVYTGIEMIEQIYSNNHNEYLTSIVSWNKLYHKSLFDDISFPKGKIHEDEATTYKLYYKCDKVALLTSSLYYYFQNMQGIMLKKFNVKRLDYLDALHDRYEFFKNHSLDFLAYTTAEKLYIYITDYANIKCELIDNNHLFKKTLKRKIKQNSFILLSSKITIIQKVRVMVSLITLKGLTIKL